jgi:hypothetical protein
MFRWFLKREDVKIQIAPNVEQDRVQRLAHVNTIMDLWVPQTQGIS